MSKRKKSVPQQLSKRERSDLQWDFAMPAPSATSQTFEVIDAQQDADHSVQYPTVLSSPKKVSQKVSLHADLSLVLRANVSPPENAQLFCLGSVLMMLEMPDDANEIGWSGCNEVVLKISNSSESSSIHRGDSVFPVTFGDFDLSLMCQLWDPCFQLKLDWTEELSVKITVYISVENGKESSIPKNLISVWVYFFPCIRLHSETGPKHLGRGSGARRQEIEALYAAVKQHHLRCPVSAELPTQPAGLRPELRQYQRLALRWMLAREAPEPAPLPEPSEWMELAASDGNRSLFFDRLYSVVSWERPPPPLLPSGGVLAEEMGLGKTVELLALVLSNPRPLEDLRSTKEDRHCQDVLVEAGDACREDLGSDFSDDDVDEWESKDDCWEPGYQEKASGCKRPRQQDIMSTIPEEACGVKSSKQTCKTQSTKPANVLRDAANRWYEEQLAGTKPKTPAATVKDRHPSRTIKCLCGSQSRAATVQCNDCLTWQHCKCVGVQQESCEDKYFCPQCWQNKELIPSGATLIISPASISRQWETEIRKHVSDPDFSLLVYTGVSGAKYEPPPRLARPTAVLMTYETLRKELDFANLDPADNLRLRHAKRFVAPPSPLLCVGWWRVCLDEAQMAQSQSGSKTFRMARRIPATHRWAVTGTPVTRSVDDLLSTLQFLAPPAPLSDPRWWPSVVGAAAAAGDSAPLHALAASVVWRTAKRDVADQINIPRQSEQVHWLTFSPVEEFFYQRQHENAEAAFVEGLDRVCGGEAAANVKLSSLDRLTMTRVLAPLLRLRQACSHPGAARGNNISFQGSALTMEELLESLIKKAATDCGDALRQQIAALNGLAAVAAMQGLWVTSAEAYRDVLRLWTEHGGALAVDKLQLIHATHNLADLLAAGHVGIPPTLRDHALRDESRALEQRYMRKHHAQLTSAASALAETSTQVNALELALSGRAGGWWRALAAALGARGEGPELMNRVRDAFAEVGLKAGRAAQRALTSSVTLMTVELGKWIAASEEARDLALDGLATLRANAANEAAVAAAVDCHIRAITALHDASRRTKKCEVCRCETQLKSYESLLFTMSSEHNKHEKVGDVVMLGQLTQGTWQASAQEIALKTMLALARNRRWDQDWLAQGSTHIKMLDAAKKEFRRARVLWMAIRDEISARDELAMCRTKLRLRLPGEVVDKKTHEDQLASLHIIEPCDVGPTGDRLESDLAVARHDLLKKNGQLNYLRTLRKREDLDTNPDPCPICRTAVGNKWSVLPCGHVYCLECLLLLGSHSRKQVKCAVCRATAHLSAVSHVSIAPPLSPSDARPEGGDFPADGDRGAAADHVSVLPPLPPPYRQEDEDFPAGIVPPPLLPVFGGGDPVADRVVLKANVAEMCNETEALSDAADIAMESVDEPNRVTKAMSNSVDLSIAVSTFKSELTGSAFDVENVQSELVVTTREQAVATSQVSVRKSNPTLTTSTLAVLTHTEMDAARESASELADRESETGDGSSESGECETEVRQAGVLRVRGSHSAKVSAVVRCLLKLRADDAAVKVLVFSTWDKVLDILEVALEQNSIAFERLTSGKKFQMRLEAFKTQARPTALLLPLRSGSKGLNLTEATHLVFVEPVLDLEFELQALGRIHRIGQTRETMVHRFLVRDSLEERIHAAVRADATSWRDDTVTLGQLRTLFSALPAAATAAAAAASS